MKITLSVTLDRVEGPEQNPHHVVEELIEALLAGQTFWVRHDVGRLDARFDITGVEVVNLRD